LVRREEDRMSYKGRGNRKVNVRLKTGTGKITNRGSSLIMGRKNQGLGSHPPG